MEISVSQKKTLLSCGLHLNISADYTEFVDGSSFLSASSSEFDRTELHDIVSSENNQEVHI